MKKKIFSIIAGLLFLLMALLQFTGIIGNVINIAQDPLYHLHHPGLCGMADRSRRDALQV